MQKKPRYGVLHLTGSGLLLAAAWTAAQAASYPTAGACVDLRAGTGGYADASRAQGFSPAVAIPVAPAFAPQSAPRQLAYAVPQAYAQSMPAQRAYPAQAYVQPMMIQPYAIQAYPVQAYQTLGPGGVITPEQKRLQDLNQQHAR